TMMAMRPPVICAPVNSGGAARDGGGVGAGLAGRRGCMPGGAGCAGPATMDGSAGDDAAAAGTGAGGIGGAGGGASMRRAVAMARPTMLAITAMVAPHQTSGFPIARMSRWSVNSTPDGGVYVVYE